jgi:hypothetical protein
MIRMSSNQQENPINIKNLITHILVLIISFTFIYFALKEPISYLWLTIGIIGLLLTIKGAKNLRESEEAKKEQEMQEWELKREKGKKHYIFKKYALYSLATGLGFVINEGENHGGELTVENLLSGNFSVISVITMLSFFYFAGVIGNLFHYNSQEEKYRKWKLYGNY